MSAEKELKDMRVSEAFELLIDAATNHEREFEHERALVAAGKRSALLLKKKRSKRQEIEKWEELRDLSKLFRDAIDALYWRTRMEFRKERPSL